MCVVTLVVSSRTVLVQLPLSPVSTLVWIPSYLTIEISPYHCARLGSSGGGSSSDDSQLAASKDATRARAPASFDPFVAPIPSLYGVPTVGGCVRAPHLAS